MQSRFNRDLLPALRKTGVISISEFDVQELIGTVFGRRALRQAVTFFASPTQMFNGAKNINHHGLYCSMVAHLISKARPFDPCRLRSGQKPNARGAIGTAQRLRQDMFCMRCLMSLRNHPRGHDNQQQQSTRETVDAMQSSAEQTTETLHRANRTDHALNLITTSVGVINERNIVIATAAEQQAQVTREVDRNLVRIRDLSQQTSKGADQTSVASNDLSRLATQLKAMTGRFTL